MIFNANRRRVLLCAGLAANAVFMACGGVQLGSRSPSTRTEPPSSPGSPSQRQADPTLNAVTVSREAGLIASGAPIPFSGSIVYLATARPDSTYAAVALALGTAGFTFRREGEAHRADYRVTLTFKKGETVVSRIEAVETVRVATIRETQRNDEALLFQQTVELAPGAYSVNVAVKDEGGSRSANTDVAITVPSFDGISAAQPIPIYEAQPRSTRETIPRLAVNPRALGLYGRDSTIAVYLEAYGGSEATAMVGLMIENTPVWTTEVQLRAAGPGLFTGDAQIPLARVGFGPARVTFTRRGSADTAGSPLFVSVGEEIPATTFTDMVGYFRYFTTPARLAALRNSAPSSRGSAWATFYRETDPNPASTENEALLMYLARMRHVNATFPEEATPGWLTHRGMVYLLLGAPDQIVNPPAGDLTTRRQELLWEYRSLNITVEFLRVGAMWRLTPESEQLVQNTAKKLMEAVP
jgi:GWxTD domain-containing protein